MPFNKRSPLSHHDTMEQQDQQQGKTRLMEDETEVTNVETTPVTNSWFSRSWSLYAISLVTSLCFLAALVGLLAAFDKKTVDNKQQFTLNTAIAVLSAATKATLLYSISDAIGQWNWIVFSGPRRRRLLDFDRIASASRGPLGSLILLGDKNVKRISIVRIGALLTLLSVAMDPFAQQLLKYRQVPRYREDLDGEGASVSRAMKYSRGTKYVLREMSSNGDALVDAEADLAMQSAIMYGIAEPLDSVLQQTKFRCPNGECPFKGDFATLAVCSSCMNLTDQLLIKMVDPDKQLNISLSHSKGDRSVIAERRDPIVRYSLPNGLYLDNSIAMTMKGTANPAEVITQDRLDWQQKAKTLIWSQSIIRHRTDPAQLLPDQESNQVEAIECALNYCVKQIAAANVTGGRYFEESREDTLFVRDPESWAFDLHGDNLQGLSNLTTAQNGSIAFHPRLSRFPRTDLSLRLNLDNHHNVYNISQVAVDGMSAFMQRTFSTCVSPLTNCSDSAAGMGSKDFEAAVSLSDSWKPINGYYDLRSNWFSPSIARVLWQTDDLKQKWASIAHGLTNGIRRGADNLTDAFEYGADNPVFGGINEVRSVEYLEPVYHIDWWWITLHCALELVGILFIVLTALRSMSWSWKLGWWGARLSGGGGAAQGEMLMSRRKEPLPLWGTNSIAILANGPAVASVLDGAKTMQEMEARGRVAEVTLLSDHKADGIGLVDATTRNISLEAPYAYQRQRDVSRSWFGTLGNLSGERERAADSVS